MPLSAYENHLSAIIWNSKAESAVLPDRILVPPEEWACDRNLQPVNPRPSPPSIKQRLKDLKKKPRLK